MTMVEAPAKKYTRLHGKAAERKARRKHTFTREEVLARIPAGKLIARLRKHALGTLVDKNKRKIILSPQEIKSIEILLRKTIPDMQATETKLTVETRPAAELSDDELAAIIANEDDETLQLEKPNDYQEIEPEEGD